jgi:aldehyde dehydrogenase (NAD+)
MMGDLRQTFDTGRTLQLSFRLDQLKQFRRLLDENYEDLLKALNKDMRKSKMEG